MAWIVGAVVSALVLVGIGIGLAVIAHSRAGEQRRAAEERQATQERRATEHRVRLEELKKAYQGLLLVESATAVGVTYIDYGNRLRDGAAALAAYEAKDDQAKKTRAHLAAALDQYRIAYDLFDLTLSAKMGRETSESYFAWYRKNHPEGYHGPATTIRAALHDTWSNAHLEMDAARAGLAVYENAR